MRKIENNALRQVFFSHAETKISMIRSREGRPDILLKLLLENVESMLWADVIGEDEAAELYSRANEALLG
ncbi:hypothetical protein M2401_004671 [Pseudomonas sp. JUb42]|jgi:hypothetical protein|uniref:hypothetical protein n=1 Tax=Pseudomonas sp. JUb42 TaxID=2940611 RepID=UPI002166DEF7|nr:hypothetical protein [Pseudomonas sp. JUb42]MCS3470913.1 hypothetical protein [Pseudomonas sp. JUb42]